MSAQNGRREQLGPGSPFTEQNTPNVELVEAIADAVSQRLDAPVIAGALVDAKAASRVLGVPATWLKAEARAERIPHRRLGKYVRFDPEELLEWAAARARGPRPRTGRHPVSKGPDAA